mmetsp:Transcript_11571/g.30778  ORF Transcript_11571/g.30778 Transcript_11571/m.30778 type:complete len:263 (-) Transcript_11571:374-1162(-)
MVRAAGRVRGALGARGAALLRRGGLRQLHRGAPEPRGGAARCGPVGDQAEGERRLAEPARPRAPRRRAPQGRELRGGLRDAPGLSGAPAEPRPRPGVGRVLPGGWRGLEAASEGCRTADQGQHPPLRHAAAGLRLPLGVPAGMSPGAVPRRGRGGSLLPGRPETRRQRGSGRQRLLLCRPGGRARLPRQGTTGKGPGRVLPGARGVLPREAGAHGPPGPVLLAGAHVPRAAQRGREGDTVAVERHGVRGACPDRPHHRGQQR